MRGYMCKIEFDYIYLYHNIERVMYENYCNLTIDVDIDTNEVKENFRKALKAVQHEYSKNRYDYYDIYIQHLLGLRPTTSMSAIMERLDDYRKKIQYKLFVTCSMEQHTVRTLLRKNKYMSKKISPLGATVKLFRTMYKTYDAIVKTYVYDPNCLSLKYNVTQSFEDEVVFQCYANNISRRLDFICPELYSWGKISNFQFEDDGYEYCCLFIIMKYIPGLTLAQSTYNQETMKNIYEKVENANRAMISEGIYHNDLHRNNIIISDNSPSDNSPLPEIVILDFGEASIGPKKPLFQD